MAWGTGGLAGASGSKPRRLRRVGSDGPTEPWGCSLCPPGPHPKDTPEASPGKLVVTCGEKSEKVLTTSALVAHEFIVVTFALVKAKGIGNNLIQYSDHHGQGQGAPSPQLE